MSNHTLKQLPGQARLARWLAQAFLSERRSHAYLLLGPEGSGRFRLAMAMAAAALCETPVEGDACGACRGCRRVAGGNHPDLHVYEPDSGSTQFKKEVIDAVCGDVSRRAFEGGAKVFILRGCDMMNAHSANHFLKTLEEPPPGTMFCLLARSEYALLPTIVSRCQVIRPLPMAPEELQRLLAEEHGFSEADAALAAGLSGGWLDVALGFDQGLIAELRGFAKERLPSLRAQDNLGMTMALKELCAKHGADKKKPRRSIILAVEFLRHLWRLAMTFKVTGAGASAKEAESIAAERGELTLAAGLRAFGDTIAALRGNADIDVALDNLFLRLARS